MDERVPRGRIRINCNCCRLPQIIPDRDGAIAVTCDDCNQHRGQRPETQLARAESHEVMLREHLTACRASEARAQEDLATAKDQARAALASRGRMADRLVRAVEADRSGHNCVAMQLGRDRHVIDLARRHREQHGTWESDV